jgi:hypothetical protein
MMHASARGVPGRGQDAVRVCACGPPAGAGRRAEHDSRPGVREFMYLRRPVLVAVSLGDLRGPASGVVELPLHLLWSGRDIRDSRFRLDDPSRRRELYRTVLREARSPDDLSDFLNGGMLTALWTSLVLPKVVRKAWENQHPALRLPQVPAGLPRLNPDRAGPGHDAATCRQGGQLTRLRTYWVGDLEVGMAELKAGHVGLVVLVNKYDGVDLPRQAAQQLLAAAAVENSFVLRPVTGVTPAPVRAAAVQARAAAAFLPAEYADGISLVLGVKSMLEEICWDEERTEGAERAWARLGQHLGFASTRLEKQYGIGPDNLWALSDVRHGVTKLNTGCTTSTIAKKDLYQLGGSVRWDQENSPGVTSLPVMVHPSRDYRRGMPVTGMRVVTSAKLEQVKAAATAFAVALADGQGRWADEQRWPPTLHMASSTRAACSRFTPRPPAGPRGPDPAGRPAAIRRLRCRQVTGCLGRASGDPGSAAATSSRDPGGTGQRRIAGHGHHQPGIVPSAACRAGRRMPGGGYMNSR